jgi:radical SAM superfamily enzyme YgiQ (UPF0313 family)
MDAHRDKPAPPLGILAAVSYLKNHYEIVILDQRLYKTNRDFYDDLLKVLKENPLYAGLSVFTGAMITFGLEISKYIKKNSNVPVLWGGVHPSLLPQQTLENDLIDYVIQGEGELTLREFTDMLADNGRMVSPIQGVWSKQGDVIHFGGERELIDLQEMPPMPYDLIDFNQYIQYYKGKKYIYYQASRGCPRRCKYCYNLVFNKGKFRSKTISKIIFEIQELQTKYSFDGVFFVDDNIFVHGKEYIMTLGESLFKMGLSWYVQGSDIVALKQYTERDFKLLEEYGLDRIAVGVESTTKKIRSMIDKQGELSDIEEVITKLKDTSILIWCTYLINFPEETISDLHHSIRFIFRLYDINKNVLNAPFFIYTPNPGTPLYEHYKNILPSPKTLEEWGRVGWERKDANIFVDYLHDEHFFQSLFLASMFNDRKISIYSPNKIFVFLANCYRPVARWRLKNLCFRFNIELSIFKRFFPDIFL